MPMYFIKPVVWNTNGYVQPSGVKFSSGYPAEVGLGHEEWNGNPLMEYTDKRGQRWRAFYTATFGNQPIEDWPGDIFIFMIASSEGTQKLVGIAGMATYIRDDANERAEAHKRLGLSSRQRAQQAWQVDNVRSAFKNDRKEFNVKWDYEESFFPPWKSPSDYFLWLDTPIELDPVRISGKQRLICMYNSYHEITRHQAADILHTARRELEAGSNQAATADRLLALCDAGDSDIETNIRQIAAGSGNYPGSTEREALIQARKGQGRFRQALLSRWKGCAVTGSVTSNALRASHIKPWRASTNKQRLDPDNGLLLSATLDALFDAGMISFDKKGKILVSDQLELGERRKLGIGTEMALRYSPTPGMQTYLDFHRSQVFRP